MWVAYTPVFNFYLWKRIKKLFPNLWNSVVVLHIRQFERLDRVAFVYVHSSFVKHMLDNEAFIILVLF